MRDDLTIITAPIGPTSDLDSYPTHLAIWGKGGYRTVATIFDRNAIPSLRREAGMVVWVVENETRYRLDDDLTTWVEDVSVPPVQTGDVYEETISFVPFDVNYKRAQVPRSFTGHAAATVDIWCDNNKVAVGLIKDPDGYFYAYIGAHLSPTIARAVLILSRG
jgi:hypothetical protein